MATTPAGHAAFSGDRSVIRDSLLSGHCQVSDLPPAPLLMFEPDTPGALLERCCTLDQNKKKLFEDWAVRQGIILRNHGS